MTPDEFEKWQNEQQETFFSKEEWEYLKENGFLQIEEIMSAEEAERLWPNITRPSVQHSLPRSWWNEQLSESAVYHRRRWTDEPGWMGRYDELTVDDVKFLISCGIDPVEEAPPDTRVFRK